MCETEIGRLHTSNKKYVYKGRKEKTHERVDKRNTYINIKKEISTMYVNKKKYKSNVSKKKEKKT